MLPDQNAGTQRGFPLFCFWNILPSRGLRKLGSRPVALMQVAPERHCLFSEMQGNYRVEPYRTLVESRKSCRACMQMSPGRIRNAAEFPFDPEVVSHWAQWLGHHKPKLLIVAQDFGSVSYFVANRGGDEPHNPTNGNLYKLLKIAGIRVGTPPEPDLGAPVFLTNSILCLKDGTMSTAISDRWVSECRARHLVPLIQYLRPPIVVGLGAKGWKSVREVFGLGQAPPSIKAAAGSSWRATDGTIVFAAAHCSGLGLANRA